MNKMTGVYNNEEINSINKNVEFNSTHKRRKRATCKKLNYYFTQYMFIYFIRKLKL